MKKWTANLKPDLGIPSWVLGISVEAARRSAGDISRAQILKEIEAGRLKSKLVGKRHVIPVDALREWLSALPDGTADDRLH